MSNPAKTAAFLSFLDLISCGLGGALLLFLIAAASTPEVRPVEGNPSVLIASHRIEGSPAAEVGLEWRAANSQGPWARGETADSSGFSVPSGPDGGGEAFAIWFAPAPGEYEVRPYLRDYPDPKGPAGPCLVRVEAFGDGVLTLSPGTPKPMEGPGRRGQVVRFKVERREGP